MSRPNNPLTQNGVEELGNLFLSVTGVYVYYVGTSAQLSMIGDAAPGVSSRCYSTIDSAIGACTSGRGDVIYILPGYTESIATADAWASLGSKTDITIIGMGRGTNRPQLTWTTATSTVLFDSANFRLMNCHLYFAGPLGATAALTVAAPITVSASGCAITDCFINYGIDADQGVTIGVTTTAAADWFEFKRNQCFCDVTAGSTLTTSFMYLVGADYCQIHDNTIDGATTATTVGSVRFITTASLGIDFRRNFIVNKKAASIHAVTQMDGVLGCVMDCGYGILDNATLAGWVAASAGNGPQHIRGYTANLAAENGALQTPVSA
jgi:hypothetical protein